MWTLLLAILLLISVALTFAPRVPRGARGAPLALAFVFLCLAGSGVLPYHLLKRLQVFAPYSWTASSPTTLVVLGYGKWPWPHGGHSGQPLGASRLIEAARLYQHCRQQNSCIVILSGGDPQRLGISEAQVMASTLESLGVSAASLQLESESRNTFENARLVRQWIDDNGINPHIILVTSGLHAWRSKTYFEHFGLRVEMAPSDVVWPDWSWYPRGLNLMLTDYALHEWIGIARFRLYNFMGWNPPPRST